MKIYETKIRSFSCCCVDVWCSLCISCVLYVYALRYVVCSCAYVYVPLLYKCVGLITLSHAHMTTSWHFGACMPIYSWFECVCMIMPFHLGGRSRSSHSSRKRRNISCSRSRSCHCCCSSSSTFQE